tara:strand:+ start:94 stop:489 length:396 start_codon:yes stop_codon:yes gene_type:complete
MEITKKRLKAIIMEEIENMQEAGASRTVAGEAGLQQFYADKDLDPSSDRVFIKAMQKAASNPPKPPKGFDQWVNEIYSFLIARGLYDEMMYPDGSRSRMPEPGTGDPEAARAALAKTDADPRAIDFVIRRL